MKRFRWPLTVREACPVIHYNLLTRILSDGKQARAEALETKVIIQQAANDIDQIKCS
jgi:hypothetical protein